MIFKTKVLQFWHIQKYKYQLYEKDSIKMIRIMMDVKKSENKYFTFY